jgi:ATP-binding cassette subfamily B protein/subfamily B ATP-binding cassette protein MsbA
MLNQFRLLRYAWPHWRALVMVVATMLLTVVVDVLRPWPAKLLVDSALGGLPVSPAMSGILQSLFGSSGAEVLLIVVAVGTVLIFLAATGLSMTNTVASVAFGQKMTYDLGADLFLHLQRQSLLFHSRRPVGDTIARVTGDPSCVQVLVTGAILPLAQSLVSLVVMFTIMWQLQPQLTMLSLTVVPFLVLCIRIYGSPMKTQTRQRRELEGRMMNVVQQAMNAMPAIQAFGREEIEHARFLRYADDTVDAYKRSTLSQMWFKFFVGLVTAVGTAAIMWRGGHYVLDGSMTIGTVLVFLSYLASLYAPLNSITVTASTLQTAAANADRVLEVLDLIPDVRDAADAVDAPLTGTIRFENVTFGYEPGRPVIKDVSLEARPGETVAIVGPTGAGKSTLVNMLMRFFDPSAGRVTVGGRDIRSLKVRSVRHQISMVLQDPFIFPYTVAENISYGRPEATREQVVEAAIAANADPFIKALPGGYDSVVGERGATLSGGEKQRLSIARAFVKDAPVLIMDEPTSALDARTEAMLLDALDRLMKGRTTFIIAHRLSTIRNADKILVLDHGRIVEQGPHRELIALGGLYSGLYKQQMEIAEHDSASTEDPVRMP